MTEIVLGPPGCGKTTSLLTLIESELAAGTEPERIGYVSFTRRAAEEAISRAAERFSMERTRFPHFRTLHSMCFRMLGLRSSDVLEGKRLQDFAQYAGVRITGRWSEDGTLNGFEKGDRILFMENLSRIRCVDLREQYDEDDDDLSWTEVHRVAAALRQYKEREGLVDFTDMITEFCSSGQRPELEVLAVDEAQDLSRAQWEMVRVLSEGCRRVLVAGDDDQCHPTGTRIDLASGGSVPIERLRDGDQIVQYDRRGQGFRSRPAKFASRSYDGDLVRINGRLECTPDHKCFVRWENRSGYVTYLMKRGDDVRVGNCQLFAGRALHAEIRRRLDHADSLWVLRWFRTRKESAYYEQEMSLKYALPTLCFYGTSRRVTMTRSDTYKFFERVRGQARWEQCLRDHGRDPAHPLLDHAGLHRRRSTYMVIRACNLIESVHAVPCRVHRHDTLDWQMVRSLTRRRYRGKVYSLDAKPYEYYVANGIVVHNCIYRWAGADVEHLIALEGDARVLDQSWRVPALVREVAMRPLARVKHRREKEWRPKLSEDGSTAQGAVGHARDFADADSDGQDILVLARNSYILREQVEPELRRRGVLYERNGHPSIRPAYLTAIRNWEKLRRGGYLSVEEARDAYEFLSSGSGVKRGFKELKQLGEEAKKEIPVSLADLRERGGLLTNAVWHEALERLPQSETSYLLAALRRGEKPSARPRVRVSTIHASKGGEADHVILMKEMAWRTYAEMSDSPEDEARVWYVGTTRARERLTIVESQTAQRCPWL